MLDVYDCHPRSKSRDPDCCSSMVRKRSCTLLGWQDGAQKHWAPSCYEYNPVVNHEQAIFLLLVKDMDVYMDESWILTFAHMDVYTHSRVNGLSLEMTSHILTSTHVGVRQAPCNKNTGQVLIGNDGNLLEVEAHMQLPRGQHQKYKNIGHPKHTAHGSLALSNSSRVRIAPSFLCKRWRTRRFRARFGAFALSCRHSMVSLRWSRPT